MNLLRNLFARVKAEIKQQWPARLLLLVFGLYLGLQTLPLPSGR